MATSIHVRVGPVIKAPRTPARISGGASYKVQDMKKKYVCLSNHADGPIGGRFTRNPREKWTVIRDGSWIGGVLVKNLDTAAEAFASIIARRALGAKVRVWGPSIDGSCQGGKIFQCNFGDRIIEEARFAVIEQTS
jgi:hypothetical protein